MSLPLERLNKARKENELLAYGFVRSNSTNIIPVELVKICLLFFMSMDGWDIENKAKWLEISGTFNEIVECASSEEDTDTKYQSIFGTLSVCSGKHHWKFKITKINLTYGDCIKIAIGNVKINELVEQDLNTMNNSYLSGEHGIFANVWDDTSFVMDSTSGGTSMHDYGKCCKEVGDEIDMYLDLDNLKLSFAINGHNYGHIYSRYHDGQQEEKENDDKYNIFKTEYKMGLTLSREGTGIELVSYQPIDIMPEMDIL